MGLDARHLREYVVRPALEGVGLHSPAAENLVMGTAAQETHLRWLRQIRGPALGLWQVEPATYHDYLQFLSRSERKRLEERICNYLGYVALPTSHERIISDLQLGAIMCRVHYLRIHDPLPAAEDIHGLGAYWKRFYNTHLGKGTVEQFVDNYGRFLQ